MPVFNVSLQFDNKGAVTAVNAFNQVSRAADSAGKSVDGATAKMRTHSAAIKETTANVKQLAAQVVGLVAAYKALDTAKGFVQRGIEYASSLEDAQTSIASIIMATNKVSTAQGKTLQGAEAFNASLEISKNLMDEMQVLALESTATFDSLVQGVSGIIAPATKAGVSLEKLPKFAVTAAQAMQTMKIPVEQMRTEIEALLSGNINKAQDLLATNLGISGEMVKNWKAQGTLVQELEKRLMAFALAGERVVNSWSGLKSNMSDALDYLGKVTGEGIFENIKQSYRELLQLILDTGSGKPGISAEFENVAGLIRDIQDAIGEGILDLTRDLIDELKELNKPENIADVKRAFAEFKDVTGELFKSISEVAGAVTSFIATSMRGWSSLPDIVQELGIVGAVAFGMKGRAALLGIGAAAEMLGPLFDMANEGQGGAEAYKAYWENKNNQGKAPAMAVSHGGGEVAPSKPAPSGPYTTTPAIPPDNTRKPTGTIENARQKIAELRREIEVLNGESSKAGFNLANKLDDIAKAGKAAGMSVAEIGALQQEYKDAFQAKALDDFNKALLQAQGNTAALKEIQIGETLRDWQQQFEAVGMSAEQYGPKIAELRQALEHQQEYKDIQTAAKFYEELADLSGDYGLSLDYQNKLIEQQAQLWQQAGIPLADVQKRVELMREDLARDPFSGFVRGARKWATETMDYAANIEGALTSAFNSASDALANFAMTGKINFLDLGNSILQMLARIGAQQAIGGIVGGLVSGLGSIVGGFFGGGGITSKTTGRTWSSGISYSKTKGWHRGGLVGFDSPTFTRDVPVLAFAGAPRFHNGGGYFAPDEYPAILQRGERVLNRDETRAYHAGMASGREPQVNVVINNTTGEEVSTQRSRDGNGNTRIDVMVGNVAAKQAITPGSNLNRAIRGTTGSRQSVIGR